MADVKCYTVKYERNTWIDRRQWGYTWSQTLFDDRGKEFAPAGATITGPDTLALVRIGDARPADTEAWEACGMSEQEVDRACFERREKLREMFSRMMERAESVQITLED